MSKKNKGILTFQLHQNYLLIMIVIVFLLGGFLWFNSKIDSVLLNSKQTIIPTTIPISITLTPTTQINAKTPPQSRIAVVLPYNGKTVYCLSNHAEEVRQAANLFDSKNKELLNNFSQQSNECLDSCRSSADNYRRDCINSTPQGSSQTACYKGSGDLYKSCGQRCIDASKKQKDNIPNQLKSYSDSVLSLLNKYCTN